MAVKLDGTQNALILDATSVALTIKSGVNTTPWTWTFPPNPGTAGYVLTTDGAGNLSWAVGGGGGGTPGGANTQVQFNSAGAFGGDPEFTWTTGTNTLALGSSAGGGNLRLFNAAGTFSTTLRAGATADWTLTLPTTAGAAGEVLTTDGTGNLSWAAGSGTPIPVTNDTTTATAEYPLFASVTTGNLTQVYTASPDYTYTPADGELAAPHTNSTTGVALNSNTISFLYTLPLGSNGLSAGTLTFAPGANVIAPPGTNWVVV